MTEQNLYEIRKEFDEFVYQRFQHPLITRVIPKITKIIQLESKKGYIDIKNEEVVDKLYNILFDCFPFKFGEEKKLETILYVFNHPDFNKTVYFNKFLDYLEKQLNKARREYIQDSFLVFDIHF